MALTRGKQIELLCKEIANDYEGWEYSAKTFKDKRLKHTDKVIIFRWTGSSISVSSQPIVGILNKKIELVWKILNKGKTDRTQFLRIMRPGSDVHPHRNRITDLEKDNAEEYIREVLDIGIRMLDENWDFSSEEALLRNLPGLLEDDLGTRYCIAQMLLGDFDYIERFYNDEIETIRPKRKKDLETIIEHIPEFKDKYEKQGILFKV
ncbi:hypothetical protein [Marinomonas sp. THO17]|uniref:hypothetical protein n=1 Tax=Marinomonas sp. THO17 TaxID=3149048 RepID=UPI00336BB817